MFSTNITSTVAPSIKCAQKQGEAGFIGGNQGDHSLGPLSCNKEDYCPNNPRNIDIFELYKQQESSKVGPKSYADKLELPTP